MKRVFLIGLFAVFTVLSFANPFASSQAAGTWDISEDASSIVTEMSNGISTASDVLMGVLPYAIGIFALFLGVRIARRIIKSVAR